LNEDGARHDSRFDGRGPFRDTPDAGGISLESALRDFGPAALDDLIPRIRALAAELDAAHASESVHGALHPSRVIIADDSTYLIAGTSAPDSARDVRYVAPEAVEGGAALPASDQFALATITYEWLFGRRVDRAAGRPVDVRAMPGVDRTALSMAFTRALSANPEDRFESCAAFCQRVSDAVVPELPLLALEAEDEPSIRIDNPAAATDSLTDAILLNEPAADPVFDDVPEPQAEKPMAFWQPATDAPSLGRTGASARFGAAALILATFVGAIFGFAAGYMARPRALQTPPQTMATAQAGTEQPIASAPTAPAPKPQEAPKAPEAPPAAPGRLLVRSTPSGASVSVDGVDRGVTPLTVRDLDLGTRSVVLARRGYRTETRPVAITRERSSRTIDVRLTADGAASAVKGRSGATPPSAAPKPVVATPEPAVPTGILLVESRPTGAAVSINGAARGATPMTLSGLAPGEYRVVMSMKGFVNFATTVRVVAGERVRAAASLTAQEQE